MLLISKICLAAPQDLDSNSSLIPRSQPSKSLQTLIYSYQIWVSSSDLCPKMTHDAFLVASIPHLASLESSLALYTSSIQIETSPTAYAIA